MLPDGHQGGCRLWRRPDPAIPSAATLALGATNNTVANVVLRSGAITRASGAAAGRGVLTVAAGGRFNLMRGRVSAILAGATANVGLEKNAVRELNLDPVTAQGVVTLEGANTYTGQTTHQRRRTHPHGRPRHCRQQRGHAQ